MKGKSYIGFVLAGLLSLSACKPVKIIEQTVFPQQYTFVWEERYGQCYDSVPYSVVALDMYSEGLTLDSAHRMQGTGYNLYLSDIFVPTGSDSLLTGTYTSIPQDSLHHTLYTIRPYTFLPGRDYEGTPHGIYLLYIVNGQLQSIQLFESGTLVVRDTTNGLTDLHFTLHYRNANNADVTYDSHFQGHLQPWVKQ